MNSVKESLNNQRNINNNLENKLMTIIEAKSQMIYNYVNGSRVVFSGRLKICLNINTMIEYCEFLTDDHIEYVPRNTVMTPCPITEYGITMKTLRCLEVAEIVLTLNDIISVTIEQKKGPQHVLYRSITPNSQLQQNTQLHNLVNIQQQQQIHTQQLQQQLQQRQQQHLHIQQRRHLQQHQFQQQQQQQLIIDTSYQQQQQHHHQQQLLKNQQQQQQQQQQHQQHQQQHQQHQQHQQQQQQNQSSNNMPPTPNPSPPSKTNSRDKLDNNNINGTDNNNTQSLSSSSNNDISTSSPSISNNNILKSESPKPMKPIGLAKRTSGDVTPKTGKTVTKKRKKN